MKWLILFIIPKIGILFKRNRFIPFIVSSIERLLGVVNNGRIDRWMSGDEEKFFLLIIIFIIYYIHFPPETGLLEERGTDAVPIALLGDCFVGADVDLGEE